MPIFGGQLTIHRGSTAITDDHVPIYSDQPPQPVISCPFTRDQLSQPMIACPFTDDRALFTAIRPRLHVAGPACMTFFPIHSGQPSTAAIIGLFECVSEAMSFVLVHSSSMRRVGS